MFDWVQQIIDWLRKPPGQYIGYAIVGLIIFLLLTVRYGSDCGCNMKIMPLLQ